MLVVKVELWPYGDAERIKGLGKMVIANVGGTAERGDYEVAVGAPDVAPHVILRDRSFQYLRGRVDGYDRSRPVWDLVQRALKAVRP